MSADALQSVRVKVDRAKRHLTQLEADIRAFLVSEPYLVCRVRDPDTGHEHYKLRIRQPIPEYFAGMVGDVIHNLRASLDNLATALAIHNGSTSKTKISETYFPISASKASFESEVPKKLAHVSAKHVQMIRRLQPYRGGTLAALRDLHDLDILDKHRAIVPVGAALKHVTINLSSRPQPTGFPRERA